MKANSSSRAAANNHANQMNPNNSAYWSSCGGSAGASAGGSSAGSTAAPPAEKPAADQSATTESKK